MPMNGSRFRQSVRDKNADPITFDCFNRGPGRSTVIAPALGTASGRKFVIHLFRYKVKLLNTILQRVLQRPSVEGAHRRD